MSGSALTADKSVLSHLRPVNLQIWVDDASNWGSLGPYRWDVGMSDYKGAIVYDYKKTKMGELKTVNEEGAIVFPRVLADFRGGALTIVGTRFESDFSKPIMLMQSARYGQITGERMIFQVGTVRTSQTTTQNSATNKVTAGGKAGVSYGVGSGELSGSYEHGFPSGSTSETSQGRLVGINLIWVPK